MRILDKFIHAVHLQRPYHRACRWYRKLTGKPDSGLSPVEITKQKHTEAALAKLESFLFSKKTLNFTTDQPPRVSIVIVLYNRAELTFACLKSLLGCPIPCEIIIVDNCSSDLTSLLFSRVHGINYIRNKENIHFLLASNQGAQHATGQYLLLLNSDTEVLPGAIESAVDRLDQNPEIGAVGGRLILPDGSLQEAGGFVWNGGTCEGYGRGDRPDDGAYLFSRPVDYCSGAFLLTPLSLWKELGGFDETFSPAYYEEVDYCFRVWDAGRSVYYEPRATIFHYEFGSSTPASSPSQLMQKNHTHFAACHKDRLAKRPSKGSCPSVFMRSPKEQSKKKILICDERLPHIKTGAGYPRANKLVRALIALGYDVSFYPLELPDGDKKSFRIYEDIPSEVEILASESYGLNNFVKFLEKRTGFYSTLLISRPTTMRKIQAIMKKIPELFKNLHLVYDAEALFVLRDIREKQISGIKISDNEINKLIGQEISLCKGCNTVISVSQEETEQYKKHGMPSFVVGHAVPEKNVSVLWNHRTDILFVGSMLNEHGPNFTTVMWMLQNVWPELSKRLPEARFIIAGTNRSRKLTEEPLPKRVVVTGARDSLESVYNNARVFVAPTQAAAGIPLKIIEAAAHGIPIVCSSLLAHQLRWQEGKELSVADEPQAFIEKCCALYTDEKLWTAQQDAALSATRKEYSEETFKKQLQKAMNA